MIGESPISSSFTLGMDTIENPVSFLSSGEFLYPFCWTQASCRKPLIMLYLLSVRMRRRVDRFGREVAY